MRLYRKRYFVLIAFDSIIFLPYRLVYMWVVEINGVENSDINGNIYA